jgi:hypothetical protein
MSTEITITSTTIDINVTESPITIEAPSGAYPLPTSVYSVFGRTGNVVAAEGDYTLTQLAGVTITSPVSGQALVYNGTSWVNNTETYVGTVTSVAATVPTGLTITGSPITTSGTLAFGLAAGYSIPTTTKQTTWDTAYNDSIVSAAVTGTTTKTLTLNQQDGGTVTANWSDLQPVTSVFGRTGDVVATSGDYNTLQVTENTNLYFTEQRARFSISGSSASGVVYSNTTGIIALDDIPNTSLFNDSVTINSKTVALGGSTTLSTTDIGEGTNLYFTTARAQAAISGTAPISVTSGVVSISQSSASTNGYLSSADWVTFNSKQNALTLGNLTSTDITVTGGTAAIIGAGSTLTLATVNTNTGTFGSITAIPVVTVNGKGLITAMSTVAVSIPSGSLSFIGDVTGTGTTGSDTTLTLATVNTNVGAYGSSTSVPTITVNAKGLVTAASQTAIPTATSSVNGLLTSTDWSTFNGKQNQLNGTGFVKVTGTTVSYDNNTYLTTIEGIAAGGELSGSYASPSLVNSAVTGKVLTGVNITGGTIADTDSILTAFGKVQNQINGLIGGSIYKGTWNASTNTPTLTSSVGTAGNYYIVSVAGTTNLNGITDWQVGDWVIYQGTEWEKVDNTDAVVSVNGFTGAVSLTTSNISEGTNLYYTDTRARASISGSTGISYNSTTGVITNSAPDQTVSLTASTGISTSGTYPSFTITNTAPDQTVALTSGTGISATGTYPNFTITNTAPDQTVGLTQGGTTTITGTYPNFTISSADQYVGTVTSIGITESVAALSITGSPVTTSGNINIGFAGAASQYVAGDGSLVTFPSIPSISGLVPYTGATQNVDLGTHSLTAADLIINHASGSGVAASITKGGNGEALTVVKSSGSGNAASITGGVTLLDELHLTTDLADAYIASATTWNAKQSAITLTTTSNSGASTFISNTLNIPTYTLAGLGGINLSSLSATSPLLYDNTTGVFSIQQSSASQAGFLSSADWTTFNSKQNALTNPVTGTGTTNYLTKFTGTSTIGNSLIWDNGTNVGIGNTNTTYKLDVSGTGRFTGNSGIGITTTADVFGRGYTGTIFGVSAVTGDTGLEINGGTSSGAYIDLGTAGTRNMGLISTTTESQIISLSTIPLVFKTNSVTALTINSSQAATFSSSVSTGGALNITVPYSAGTMTILTQDNLGNGIYLAPRSNLNFDYGVAGNTDAYINYLGYQNGSAHFRSLGIGNGKGGAIAFFDGVNSRVGIGTNTPDSTLQVVGTIRWDALSSSNGGTAARYITITNTGQSSFFGVDSSVGGFTGVAYAAFIYTDSKPIIFAPNSVVRMTISNDGNVGIGVTPDSNKRLMIKAQDTSSGSFALLVQNSAPTNLFYVRNDGYGYLLAAAWAYGSDRRIKENINYIETGLNKVMALKPVTFDYINGIKNNIGWIAQDVQEVIPEAVGIISETNDQLTLKSDFIVPFLVKAMQEQQAQIQELSKQNEELSNRLIKLESK